MAMKTIRGPVWVCSECDEDFASEELARKHQADHVERAAGVARERAAMELLSVYMRGAGGLGGHGMPEETLRKLRAMLADDDAEAAPADPCRCGHALLSHDAVGASSVSSPSGYVGACVHCSCKAFTRRRRAKEAGGG